MKKILTAVCLVISLSFQSVQAWWDTPHMLVAEIAYQNLNPQVQKRADELIALHAEQYPKTNDFVSAAVWADDIRAAGDKTYSSWHYVTLFFQDANSPVPTKASFPEKYQIAWAVENEVSILQNPKESDANKGLALRRLIHWAGDIHQPLHAATHVSPNYPKGDSGGNLFLLALPKPLNNLHSYWDSGLDHWAGTPRPLSPADKTKLSMQAKHLQEAYARNDLGSMDPYDWAIDSHTLARSHAYTGIEYVGLPSIEYSAQGQLLSEQQVTLAGQRLAAILNGAL